MYSTQIRKNFKVKNLYILCIKVSVVINQYPLQHINMGPLHQTEVQGWV